MGGPPCAANWRARHEHMSAQQRASFPGELGLPGPRSPAELDRKVLRYARSRAPEPSPRPPRLLWWGSGLATASVAALAVLIALPQAGVSPAGGNPATLRGEISQQALPATGAATAAESPPGAVLHQRAATMNRPEADLNTPAAAANPPAARLSAPRTASQASAADGSEPAAALAIPTPPREPSGTVDDVPEVSADSLLDDAGRGSAGTELARLARLLAAGSETAARDGYRALRARCPQCELPPTLERALAQQGADTRY